MGVKVDQFDVPVCNSFKAKILNDPLCYEVDPNNYKNSLYFENDLKIGLTFLVDLNEDRKVLFDKPTKINDENLDGKIIHWTMDKIMITLNTIGEILFDIR